MANLVWVPGPTSGTKESLVPQNYSLILHLHHDIVCTGPQSHIQYTYVHKNIEFLKIKMMCLKIALRRWCA